MKATIDSAGRIVVPKSLRQALHLKPGQALEIRAGDGRLEIEVAATPMTLQKRGRGVVAIPELRVHFRWQSTTRARAYRPRKFSKS
jgi:AbrB family looped-hinge helix DNA binding protein